MVGDSSWLVVRGHLSDSQVMGLKDIGAEMRFENGWGEGAGRGRVFQHRGFLLYS